MGHGIREAQVNGIEGTGKLSHIQIEEVRRISRKIVDQLVPKRSAGLADSPNVAGVDATVLSRVLEECRTGESNIDQEVELVVRGFILLNHRKAR